MLLMIQLKLFNNASKKQISAFTIVELLVVIIVIGILAAITVTSYTGVSKKAVDASLQSDLTNAKTKLQMYQVEYGSFPTAMTKTGEASCPSAPTVDDKYCIKPSEGNSFAYTGTKDTFTLDSTRDGTNYRITESTAPTIFIVSTGPETITLGAQVWMKYNINTGTMVNASTTPQTLSQKWCYSNLESNCTTYGGLYQWNTAMNGSTTEGAQGICPDGFRVPTGADWTTLASSVYGTQLKIGETSGFDAPLGGNYDASFANKDGFGYFWTSKQQDATTSWYRAAIMDPGAGTMTTSTSKLRGFSLRCLKN